METDFQELIRVLAQADIEFIIVGGAAATVHGSARLTSDLDIVYRRSDENISRLIRVKRAAGRPKDFEAIAELEALLEESKQSRDS